MGVNTACMKPSEGSDKPAKYDSGGIITHEVLTEAVRQSVSTGVPFQIMARPHEFSMESASALAEYVLNFFGYSDRIIDNQLESEDRDLFYMLEDAGILRTEREETTLYDGREWRTYYWLMDKKNIIKLNEDVKVDEDVNIQEGYEEIFKDEDIFKAHEDGL